MKLQGRSLWWAAGGLAVGTVFGALMARLSSFWGWLTSADWSSLPAATVGAAVPAVAGVVFAQALARRSVSTLRQAELDATDAHLRRQAEAEAADRMARRDAWDGVYDKCEALVDALRADDFSKAVQAAAREFDRRSREASRGTQTTYTSIREQASTIARYGAKWSIQLRRGLPRLLDQLTSLVENHRVEAMRHPLAVLRMLEEVVADESRWPPEDVDEIIRAAQEPGGAPPITNIGHHSFTAISYLATVAGRQRVAPHGPEELDPWVTTGGFGGQRAFDVNLLDKFASLGDLIERDGILD